MTVPARIPTNEDVRMAALRSLEVLDTADESLFDELTRMAAAVCGTPIALVSLVDVDRQWFKANVGLPGVTETPRDVAFCSHAILGDELFEIPDVTVDPRFASNPLVTSDPAIRFYAGAPLRVDADVRLGTLCVIDRTPRKLDARQRELLRMLADIAVEALQMRAAMKSGRTAMAELVVAEQRLAYKRKRLELVIEGMNAGTWEWNLQTDVACFNERWAEVIGYRLHELEPITMATWRERMHPEDAARARQRLAQHLSGELPFMECEMRVRHRDGSWIWVLDRGRVLTWTADGKPEWMFGTHIEITERVEAERATRRTKALLDRTSRLAGVGGADVDLRTGEVSWSDEVRRIHEVDDDFVPTVENGLAFFVPADRAMIERELARLQREGGDADVEVQLVTAKGRTTWVRMVGTVELEDGEPARISCAFQDITERRAMSRALEENHELLRVTLESIGDAVITTDRRGCVAWLNPVAERMTGWTNAEATGLPLGHVFRIVNEETRLPVENPVERCLAEHRVVGLANHTVLIARNGDERSIADSAAPIRGSDDKVLGAVLVFHDVSEQRRLSHEMSHRARHDSLTGLVNRAEFDLGLGRALASSAQDGSVHCLLFIDLDQFKLVNDACGHSVGDQLLRQVADLIRGSVRSEDTVARVGGDEFAVILARCDAKNGLVVAQKLCDRMDEFRFAHGERRFRIGASIGLVPIDASWPNTTMLVQAADASCFAAKEGGRNRVHAWDDPEVQKRSRRGEMQWASRIEQAIDDDRFELWAQRIAPVGETTPGLHCEVLLRLREADGSLVMPGAFLPAAERFHLASRIDRFVLRKLFAFLDDSPRVVEGIASIAVNLSGQSIGDREFHRHAAELVAGLRFDPGKLVFEVTETAAVTNLSDAAAFIGVMRELGIRVALDDFGAGASSFGYLKTLPVDILKIDGQFIVDLVHDELDQAAVRCFRDVARIMGMKTVAEWVENEAVMAAVTAAGIDYAQGYLVHRPEPVAELVGGLLERAMSAA